MARIKASPERLRLAGQAARAEGLGRDATDLRQQLKEQIIADHIKALVNSAPALDTEARERLARLLNVGGSADAS